MKLIMENWKRFLNEEKKKSKHLSYDLEPDFEMPHGTISHTYTFPEGISDEYMPAQQLNGEEEYKAAFLKMRELNPDTIGKFREDVSLDIMHHVLSGAMSRFHIDDIIAWVKMRGDSASNEVAMNTPEFKQSDAFDKALSKKLHISSLGWKPSKPIQKKILAALEKMEKEAQLAAANYTPATAL